MGEEYPLAATPWRPPVYTQSVSSSANGKVRASNPVGKSPLQLSAVSCALAQAQAAARSTLICCCCATSPFSARSVILLSERTAPASDGSAPHSISQMVRVRRERGTAGQARPLFGCAPNPKLTAPPARPASKQREKSAPAASSLMLCSQVLAAGRASQRGLRSSPLNSSVPALRPAPPSRCRAQNTPIAFAYVRRKRPGAALHASAAPPGMSSINRVLALDFDGVVCDSVGESALSAWKVISPRCIRNSARAA